MLITKYLKAGEVSDLNHEGRFIKIISSETEVSMRVTAGADILIDTKAAAGFDVETNRLFSLIQVTTDNPQKVQMWVSQHKLNYDALTSNSNVNQSALIEHYGGSQQVLAFEKGRKAITLFSDSEPFWYGGEGVTVENGIPVGAGVATKIEGAGELHIAINKSPEILPSGAHNIIELPKTSYYSSTFRWIAAAGDYIYMCSAVDKKVYYLRDGVAREVVDSDGVYLAKESYCASVRGNKVYVGWENNKMIELTDGAITAEYLVGFSGFTESIGAVNDAVFVVGLRNSSGGNGVGILRGSEVEYKFNTGSASNPDVYVTDEGKVYLSHGDVYVFDSVDDIPELKSDAQPDENYIEFTSGQENENFIILSGGYGKHTIVNKKDGQVIRSAVQTNQICVGVDGLLYALEGGELKRSDDGYSWVAVLGGLYENSTYNKILMAGRDMVSLPSSKGQHEGVEFSHYEMIPQRNTPRAMIRMLKEVV